MLKSREKYYLRGTVNGITSDKGIKEIVDFISTEIGQKVQLNTILDIGSSNGSAIDSFRRNCNVKRAIGVEFIKERYEEAVIKYPDCEFYHSAIQERLDLVSDADVIFMNDICFPNELLDEIYSSIKKDTILIYNKITNTIKLSRKYGYDKKKDFRKIHVNANNTISEFHITIKK